MTKAAAPLLSAELEEFLRLVGDADNLELKLTVPDEDRYSTAASLGVDPLDGRIRLVFFFDTPDLALDRAGVVVRARRTQGAADDTVVKLRPVVPGELPREVRDHRDFVVEIDAMPGSYICSGSFKGRTKAGGVLDAVSGQQPLRKLFSKQQRSFYADHAPAGIELDDLSVLGPVNAPKLKVSPEGLGRRLAVELWFYPDGARILELSTKCAPGDWFETATESRDFLQGLGVELTGVQSTKTRSALEYFAALVESPARGDDGPPAAGRDSGAW